MAFNSTPKQFGTILLGVASLGAFVLNLPAAVGRVTLFVGQTFRAVAPPWYGRNFVRQLVEIGFYSLPVVGMTAIFTGMVLALQSYTGFARFSAESAIPNVVVVSITRELGPVLAGLIVAGRVGSAMAAEIGTMRVTEQIDALWALSTNPFRYLVLPRVLAAVLVLPLLVAGRRYHRSHRRILHRHSTAWISSWHLHSKHLVFPRSPRCHLRTRQSRSLRLHHCSDGLLPRLYLPWRSRRRRHSRYLCCGLGFYSDFDF